MTARIAATPHAESGSTLISPQRRNFVFLAITLGMLMAALDQTIVATALPTIVADLGDAGHQSWVVTSYLLASTIITALAGRLGDLFGRKRVFQAAVTLFVLEPTFDRLVRRGYAQRDVDRLSLTPSGARQVDFITTLIREWIVDKLSRSPNFQGRPDRAQVQTALDRIAHRIVAQPDWGDDQRRLSATGREATKRIPRPIPSDSGRTASR